MFSFMSESPGGYDIFPFKSFFLFFCIMMGYDCLFFGVLFALLLLYTLIFLRWEKDPTNL